MHRSGQLRVSERGQMSLPATTRHRWGLADGGDLGYLDLGDAIIIVPGGVNGLRQQLLDAVTDQDWEKAQAGFGDDDLVTE